MMGGLPPLQVCQVSETRSFRAGPLLSSLAKFVMRRSNGDSRPPLVVAIGWVQQITTISLEMALPAGVGYWLDRRWGTDPWLVSAGALLGFVVAMRHLLQLAARASRNRNHSRTHDPKA